MERDRVNIPPFVYVNDHQNAWCASCGHDLGTKSFWRHTPIEFGTEGIFLCQGCFHTRQFHFAVAKTCDIYRHIDGAWRISRFRSEEFTIIRRWDQKKEETMATKEEKPQTEEKPLSARLAEHGGMIAGAAFDGVKLATVNGTSQILVEIARKASKNNPMLEAALADPEGRQLIIAAMAILIHEVAIEFPGIVPKNEFVALAARKQITASTFLLATSGMDKGRSLFSELLPLLTQMGDAGEKMLAAELPADARAHAAKVDEEKHEREPA